jgi:3-dehydroquinate dehydratase-2
MSLPIHVLNGPNLNLLGTREPHIYGTATLADIEARLRGLAAEANRALEFAQTNSEGALVDLVQAARTGASGLILNAGAYTHTSIALHDALRALSIPVIEVHLSNPLAREAFRHVNHVSPAVMGTIAGLGADGYEFALMALLRRLAT